jgi:hypothetical protein
VLSCVGDHICRSLTLCIWSDSEPTNKDLREEGASHRKYLPQSPFTWPIFSITTFGIAFYQSNLSTGLRDCVSRCTIKLNYHKCTHGSRFFAAF